MPSWFPSASYSPTEFCQQFSIGLMWRKDEMKIQLEFGPSFFYNFQFSPASHESYTRYECQWEFIAAARDIISYYVKRNETYVLCFQLSSQEQCCSSSNWTLEMRDNMSNLQKLNWLEAQQSSWTSLAFRSWDMNGWNAASFLKHSWVATSCTVRPTHVKKGWIYERVAFQVLESSNVTCPVNMWSIFWLPKASAWGLKTITKAQIPTQQSICTCPLRPKRNQRLNRTMLKSPVGFPVPKMASLWVKFANPKEIRWLFLLPTK